MCGKGRHWGHMLARVAIILFVFWAGMALGELKGELRAAGYEHGYGMMGGWAVQQEVAPGYGYGRGMVGAYPVVVSPSAVATTTKK